MSDHSTKPSFLNPRLLRWASYLWREAIAKSWEPIAPAHSKPRPNEWSDSNLTAAWLGHSTVLINFFGIKILTDPVLFRRIGIRIPFLFTIGPKRLTAPALTVDELPKIDVILLSHAHFDHIDWRTLSKFDSSLKVIMPSRTRDLLRWTHLRDITELQWGHRWGAERKGSKQSSLAGGEHLRSQNQTISNSLGEINITAVPVKHWGARMQHDDYRGYNGYFIERNGRRIVFAGDTALTDTFRDLARLGGIDLIILPIGCYNPWIRSHCSPEQAVQMANDAGAKFIMPVHHQTFRLSFEPFREPIERFQTALRDRPERIALREIGETFVLPV